MWWVMIVELDSTQNHLRDKPLSMSLWEFLDWVHWGGKTYSLWVWHRPLVWGPGLKTREKVSWVLAFFSFCLLTLDAGWPTASSPCWHAFPVTKEGTFKRWAQTNPSFLTLLLLGICDSNEKNNHRTTSSTKPPTSNWNPDHEKIILSYGFQMAEWERVDRTREPQEAWGGGGILALRYRCFHVGHIWG